MREMDNTQHVAFWYGEKEEREEGEKGLAVLVHAAQMAFCR